MNEKELVSSNFPKKKLIEDPTQIQIEQKFLVKKHQLILDRMKCIGCGICSMVCPKDAISLEPAEVALKTKTHDSKSSIIKTIDKDKCVYCGTCTYFCPFDAIHMYEDGEKINPNALKIAEKHAVPVLASSAVKCFRLKRDAKVYWEGEITIKEQIPVDPTALTEYYTHKCPDHCHRCETICPTDAIRIKSLPDAQKSKKIIDIDEDLCIKCRACEYVCYLDLFKVKWNKINVKGAYNDIFWTPIEDRLKNGKIIKSQ
jgi:ferredoxin